MVFKETGYIYFLIYRKEIIYIGQTVDIITRVRTYLTYAYFDDIRLIECPVDKLRHYEKRLIGYFKPKVNSTHNPDKTGSYKNMPKRTEKRRKRIWEFASMRQIIQANPSKLIEEIKSKKKAA